MADWFTRRLSFWRDAFYNKVRAGVGVLITVFTLLLILRDAVLDPKYRDWFLLKYIPKLPWYWWAIIGLVALLLLILESSYDVHRSEISKLRTKHRERLTEIKAQFQLNDIHTHTRELIAATSDISKPRSVSGQVQGSALQEREGQEAEPNIVFLRTEITLAHTDDTGIVEGELVRRPYDPILTREDVATRNCIAVVANYSNEPLAGRKVRGTGDVSARLLGEGLVGKPPHQFNRGVWLDEPDSTVFFGVNDSHRLTLAIACGEDTPRLYIVGWEYAKSLGSWQLKGLHPESDAITVNVQLITESDGTMLAESTFRITLQHEPDFDIKIDKVN